jgi:hypothetical protein
MARPTKPAFAPLKLLADDIEDLNVISAALQDAVCTIGDIAFEAGARRLTLPVNRFRWESPAKRDAGERVRSALQFGGVLAVKARRLRLDAKQGVLALLAMGFEPGEAPGGAVTLTFAGGGELRLTVECIDAVLADLSTPWATPRRPAHDVADR